jgi:hypothetical protein
LSELASTEVECTGEQTSPADKLSSAQDERRPDGDRDGGKDEDEDEVKDTAKDTVTGTRRRTQARIQ